MAIKLTGSDPMTLSDLGAVQPGTVLRVGPEMERVLLSAYPDRFEVVKVKPKRRRARSAAEPAPPADRSMRSPTDEG